MTPALETQGIAISFAGVQALRRVSLRVAPGERQVIIGPNGAGKSTLFNLIAGQLRPTAGRVLLFGEDANRYSPHQRARRGLARTFQISRLFKTLTVAENAWLAANGPRPLSSRSFRPPRSDDALAPHVDRLLADWGLAEQRDRAVQNISHGNQRLVEIVLALAMRPRLILLDEPTAGLSGAERDMVIMRLRQLPRDITIVLTDHDMDVVFDIADRIMVLNYGETVAEGSPAEIRSNPRVQDIYLGEY
jgi:branched-chain amino acid transport system ATP-binding protein